MQALRREGFGRSRQVSRVLDHDIDTSLLANDRCSRRVGGLLGKDIAFQRIQPHARLPFDAWL
jgi:hypothetical protein